jgi:hypothetical protein
VYTYYVYTASTAGRSAAAKAARYPVGPAKQSASLRWRFLLA